MSSHCVQKYGSSRIGVKCLRAKTQHPCEWFSDFIWMKVPKTVLVGYETVVAHYEIFPSIECTIY
jgi:hypothetical protein